jgi:hypothetical protein
MKGQHNLKRSRFEILCGGVTLSRCGCNSKLAVTFHRRKQLECGAPSAALQYACRLISNPISRRPDPNRRGSSTSRRTAKRQPRCGRIRLPRNIMSRCRSRSRPSRSDSRSEFKAEVRQACQAKAIRLLRSCRPNGHKARPAIPAPATLYVLIR